VLRHLFVYVLEHRGRARGALVAHDAVGLGLFLGREDFGIEQVSSPERFVLFIDHISKLKRDMVVKKFRKLAKDRPPARMVG